MENQEQNGKLGAKWETRSKMVDQEKNGELGTKWQSQINGRVVETWQIEFKQVVKEKWQIWRKIYDCQQKIYFCVCNVPNKKDSGFKFIMKTHEIAKLHVDWKEQKLHFKP